VQTWKSQFDPIFQGLTIAMMFGAVAATGHSLSHFID
jgi:hypothetical protein